MLFSVIVPVYNVQEYLSDCIESILRQTEQNFELILLNDGSKDNSGIICDEYAAKYPDRIKTFHNESNSGLLLTRRKLFKLAKGEWIVCVDSDDYIADNALERIRLAFETQEVDMVMYNLLCIHKDGHKEAFCPSLEPDLVYSEMQRNLIYNAITKNKYMNSLCTKAFKRELIDVDTDYTDWKDLKIGEDLFQSFPLWDNSKGIVYIDETLYYYRKNENGMTSQLPLDFYKRRKTLWDREDYYAAKWGIDERTKDIILRQRVSEIMDYIRTVSVREITPDIGNYIREIKEDSILTKLIVIIPRSVNFREKIIYLLVMSDRLKLLQVYCHFERKVKNFLKGK